MEEPGFWDDAARSAKLVQEAKNLKDTVDLYRGLETEYEDIQVMIEMGYEENDASLIPEIQEMLTAFETKLEKLRLQTLLSGEYDKCNAILRLNAGAGGTESCDWCSMLYRMYCRWAERRDSLWRFSIFWTARRRGLSLSRSRSTGRMPSVT